jgi:uncharacterized protein YuzB (UPF0349 family)
MSKNVTCCVNNFQQFRYGNILQELVDQGHDVQLERCQSQCVSCRRQPTAIVDGMWKGFDDLEQLREYVYNGIVNQKHSVNERRKTT